MNRIATIVLLWAVGCGSTGGALVTFTGRVSGPPGVSGTLAFQSPKYRYTLSSAMFHVGAIYLDGTPISAGGAEQPCILPGSYDGEVFGTCNGTCGIDVNLLSADPVPFPLPGRGIAGEAKNAEVWLVGASDINAENDPTPILSVSGTAVDASNNSFPFKATVTIGNNRKQRPSNVFPGEKPICGERIIGPITPDERIRPFVPFVLTQGGTLDLHVDPSAMFNKVDFSLLSPTGGVYVIPDDQSSVGDAFFEYGVRSHQAYQFTWTP
jgi:hypothetical protein